MKDRIDGLRRQCARAKEELSLLFLGDNANFVRWGTQTRGTRRGVQVTLNWTPISVAPILAETLWKKPREVGVALVSATLATDGGFGYLRERLGISPNAPHGHGNHRRIAIRLWAQLPALCPPPPSLPVGRTRLRASVRRRDDPIDRDVTRWRVYPVHLVPRFECRLRPSHPIGPALPASAPRRDAERAVDRDIQGRGRTPCCSAHSRSGKVSTCRAQVFGWSSSTESRSRSPTALCTKRVSRRSRERAQTGSTTSHCPRHSLKLKQGFGRLIRTSEDRGVVAILDSRLVSKSYGARFLRFLPPAHSAFTRDEVRDFFAQSDSDAALPDKFAPPVPRE